MFPDIFRDDAFSMMTLTAAVNDIDHVPGRAGELVFTAQGVSRGVETTSVALERRGEELELIQTSMRLAPAAKMPVPDKAELLSFEIPQIKLEDTIYASSI